MLRSTSSELWGGGSGDVPALSLSLNWTGCFWRVCVTYSCSRKWSTELWRLFLSEIAPACFTSAFAFMHALLVSVASWGWIKGLFSFPLCSVLPAETWGRVSFHFLSGQCCQLKLEEEFLFISSLVSVASWNLRKSLFPLVSVASWNLRKNFFSFPLWPLLPAETQWRVSSYFLSALLTADLWSWNVRLPGLFGRAPSPFFKTYHYPSPHFQVKVCGHFTVAFWETLPVTNWESGWWFYDKSLQSTWKWENTCDKIDKVKRWLHKTRLSCLIHAKW